MLPAWTANLPSCLTPRDCAYARLGAGLSEDELAWLREHALPFALEVLAGRLPWPGWDGWEVGADGRLYPPGQRQGYRPEDVASIHWLRQLTASWRAKHREARDEELPAVARGR